MQRPMSMTGPPWMLVWARRLLDGRERGRPPDLVDDALDEGSVGLARLPGGQRLGVGREGLPGALATGQILVGTDVDELVGLNDDRLPEADDHDTVLLEELHRHHGEELLD